MTSWMNHPEAKTKGAGRADPRQIPRKEGRAGGAAGAWEGPEAGRPVSGPKLRPMIDRKGKAAGSISVLVSCIRGVAGCPRRWGSPGSPAWPEARARGKACPRGKAFKI